MVSSDATLVEVECLRTVVMSCRKGEEETTTAEVGLSMSATEFMGAMSASISHCNA